MSEQQAAKDVAESMVRGYRKHLADTGRIYPSMVGLHDYIVGQLSATESYNFMDAIEAEALALMGWRPTC